MALLLRRNPLLVVDQRGLCGVESLDVMVCYTLPNARLTWFHVHAGVPVREIVGNRRVGGCEGAMEQRKFLEGRRTLICSKGV
jgi:hypothetical protein